MACINVASKGQSCCGPEWPNASGRSIHIHSSHRPSAGVGLEVKRQPSTTVTRLQRRTVDCMQAAPPVEVQTFVTTLGSVVCRPVADSSNRRIHTPRLQLPGREAFRFWSAPTWRIASSIGVVVDRGSSVMSLEFSLRASDPPVSVCRQRPPQTTSPIAMDGGPESSTAGANL